MESELEEKQPDQEKIVSLFLVSCTLSVCAITICNLQFLPVLEQQGATESEGKDRICLFFFP